MLSTSNRRARVAKRRSYDVDGRSYDVKLAPAAYDVGTWHDWHLGTLAPLAPLAPRRRRPWGVAPLPECCFRGGKV